MKNLVFILFVSTSVWSISSCQEAQNEVEISNDSILQSKSFQNYVRLTQEMRDILHYPLEDLKKSGKIGSISYSEAEMKEQVISQVRLDIHQKIGELIDQNSEIPSAEIVTEVFVLLDNNDVELSTDNLIKEKRLIQLTYGGELGNAKEKVESEFPEIKSERILNLVQGQIVGHQVIQH